MVLNNIVNYFYLKKSLKYKNEFKKANLKSASKHVGASLKQINASFIKAKNNENDVFFVYRYV